VVFYPFVLVGIISYFQQQRYFMFRSTGEARAGLAPALASCDNGSWYEMSEYQRKHTCNLKRKGTYSMRNSTLYVVIIVVGIIGLVIGVLYQANVLGNHPTRAIAGIAAGVILIIIGIAGMMVTRNRSRL
jgi:hypothetical protein